MTFRGSQVAAADRITRTADIRVAGSHDYLSGVQDIGGHNSYFIHILIIIIYKFFSKTLWHNSMTQGLDRAVPCVIIVLPDNERVRRRPVCEETGRGRWHEVHQAVLGSGPRRPEYSRVLFLSEGEHAENKTRTTGCWVPRAAKGSAVPLGCQCDDQTSMESLLMPDDVCVMSHLADRLGVSEAACPARPLWGAHSHVGSAHRPLGGAKRLGVGPSGGQVVASATRVLAHSVHGRGAPSPLLSGHSSWGSVFEGRGQMAGQWPTAPGSWPVGAVCLHVRECQGGMGMRRPQGPVTTHSSPGAHGGWRRVQSGQWAR